METVEWGAVPWVVTFDKKDTLEEKLKKAAHVKPSLAQLSWMEKEFIAFVHYGPNTFNHVQWGNGTEKITDYCPDKLEVSQWCRVCSRAGMKMMIFTAKHHDGFCQWNTKTTEFSSVNAPAAEDVMESLRSGCEENGLRLGVYLSPWDMHQRKEGLWPTRQYNEYFLAQLRELLTNYGRIDEVWFDGACSDYKIWEGVPSYEPEAWYELIEKLQPSAVVRLYDPYCFGTKEEWDGIRKGERLLKWNGKGVRWVGNEGGISRENEWSVQPVFSREIAENATWKDLGEETYYENAAGAIWYPLEVNTVLLNQWFWNEKTSAVRSLSDLVEVYYHSIGNNGVLLLNVCPDTQGIIGEEQEKRLLQLRAYIDETFGTNLAAGAEVIAERQAEGCEGYRVLENDKKTYWMAGKEWELNRDSASLILDLKGEKFFDQIMLREYIYEGQRVAGWTLEIWEEERWREVARSKTIGYKTIRRFEAVKASRVRFTVQRSWDVPMISGFGLFLSAKLPKEKEQRKEVRICGADVDENSLQSGLWFHSYDGGLQSAALLDSVFAVKLLTDGLAEKVGEDYAEREIGYALSFEGYLKVPEKGRYTFRMENADGGQFYLGGELFLNHDEPHEKSSVMRAIELEKGYYAVKVLYTSFRHPGWVRLFWQRPGRKMEEVEACFYYSKKP